jgi:hypothetical protein
MLNFLLIRTLINVYHRDYSLLPDNFPKRDKQNFILRITHFSPRSSAPGKSALVAKRNENAKI